MTPAILEFGELDSTQAEAWRVSDKAVPPVVILAERQTAGRGRTGNQWVSPAGNLYMSVIMECEEPPAKSPQFSLLAGLAVARVLYSSTGIPVALKWPNDILVSGRKLGGVISERRGFLKVVGIGINISGDIVLHGNGGLSACCLGDYGYGSVGCRGLAESLGRELLTVELEWKAAGYTFLVDEYQRFFHDLGQRVVWESDGAIEEGEIVGVDVSGALLVSVRGLVKKLYAGEVRHVRAA